MRTDDLIVQLAASARPVRPLAPPLQRLVQWSLGAVCLTTLGVAMLGVRPDTATVAREGMFLLMALLTVATALISATAALVLSVPGAERSAAQRWMPIAALAAWATLLTLSIQSGGATLTRIAAFPFHLLCLAQIVGLSMIPAIVLFRMLHQAAPLRRHWSAGLASLAALALAAAGTQFLCPLNDPAHLLVGHLGPVAVLACLGAALGTRPLIRN